MLPGLGCTSGTRILYRGERARLREQGPRDTSPSILSDTEAGNPNVATGRMRWKSGSFSLAKVNAGQREPWRLESRHSRLDLQVDARLRVAAELQPFAFEYI